LKEVECSAAKKEDED